MNIVWAVSGVEQNKKTGKWASKLESIINGVATGELTSAYVWQSELGALIAARRAAEIATETGVLPNMCKEW